MHEKKMQKIALETVCYVAGAGAFSVFIRWLQTMLAYNEEGLVDRSVFNLLVPAIIIASAVLFYSFVKKFEKQRYFISEDIFEALKNDSKLYGILRYIMGIVMVAGGLLLLAQCEIDKEAKFLRVLSLLGVVTGVCFPLLLSMANKPHVTKISSCCFLGTAPVIFFCFWLVTCYKINSINPVLWDYSVEIITIIVCIISFFYLAGFQFSVPNAKRALFFSMMGAALSIMILADKRYMGMQLMYAASAAMQLYCVWVLIVNMGQKEKEYKVQPEDGFERL